MGKRLGIAAVLLGVLLVAADRGGQVLAERVVAADLQDKLRSPDKPSVDIAGIPFLPQLISRDFDQVTLSVRNADAGGVKVARIDAELHGVRQAGAGARVRQVRGGGLITYDALTAVARGLKVSYGGEGLVAVSVGVGSVQASGSARPKIVGDELVIKPEKVSSSLTGSQDLGDVQAINVKLRDIPANLTIDLDPTEQGVGFDFSGTDVLFTTKEAAASLGPARGGAFPLGLPAARPVGSRR